LLELDVVPAGRGDDVRLDPRDISPALRRLTERLAQQQGHANLRPGHCASLTRIWGVVMAAPPLLSRRMAPAILITAGEADVAQRAGQADGAPGPDRREVRQALGEGGPRAVIVVAEEVAHVQEREIMSYRDEARRQRRERALTAGPGSCYASVTSP
jgi:hypothetical protein